MPTFKSKAREEQNMYSDTYNKILKFLKVKKFIKQEINNRKDVKLIDEEADRFILKDLKNNLCIAVYKDLIEILDSYYNDGLPHNIKVLEYYKVSEGNLTGEILNILKTIQES